MKKWKFKTHHFEWIKKARCPCCGKGSFEFIDSQGCGILVNCESRGRVNIKDFWIPSRVCNNPLCEWSKIKKEVSAHCGKQTLIVPKSIMPMRHVDNAKRQKYLKCVHCNKYVVELK